VEVSVLATLQECAAQLNQLGEQLPFGAVAHLGSELDTVMQQAMQVVQGTGHEQSVGQLTGIKDELTQQLMNSLGLIRSQLQQTASAIMAGR
jgi:ribulose 1,5-bisphosphate synthetase/thiazole synthase